MVSSRDRVLAAVLPILVYYKETACAQNPSEADVRRLRELDLETPDSGQYSSLN